MSTTQSAYRAGGKGQPERDFDGIWETPLGLDNLTSVSHRIVGKRFVVTGFIFFLIAGVLALMARAQLIVPNNNLFDQETYNQIFTMHGTIMMFLFAIPILEGIAAYLIPLMVGARDLAFPRLGAFGYYCYVFGGLIVLSSFLFDAAPSGGWFMYVPLSTLEFTPGLSADFWLIGITLAEIASVTAAVELIASILCTRAPGMSLTKMPIFAWYILVTAFMIALGFPPLIIGSIMLEAERMLGLPFFDPALGGDPLLWQHLFWLFGHPEVYIIFLPAAGMVSTILPVFVGKPLYGYGFVVAALVTMGLISFGLWAHHMFATGLPDLSLALFSAASMMVTIPTGVQVFCWIATLSEGRPRMAMPMLFVLGFLFIFVLGGLTGVMLAAVPFNLQAHDSYFVVAHLHYVLIGGMVFPLFAGAYYWIPHATGRMMSERLGRWVFWLMFVGFNAAFMPMHVTGLLGMPRRIAIYPEGLGWDLLNLWSTVFSFMFAAGVGLFCVDFFRHRRHGQPAPRDPWGAGTLEWLYQPVPPGYNFRTIPTIEGREPLWDQPALLATAPEDLPGALRVANDGRRETMGCHPVTGAPIQIVRLPHPTWIPLICALCVSTVFLALLLKLYVVAGVASVLSIAGFVAWGWEPSDSGVARQTGTVGAMPVNVVSPLSHTHVGIVATLLISLALYGSLVFGALYLWNVRPDFDAALGQTETPMAMAAAVAAFGTLLAGRLAWFGARRQRRAFTAVALAVASVLAVVTASLLGLAALPVDAWASAIGAALWALVAFVGLHLGVGALWALMATLRLVVDGPSAAGHGLPALNLATWFTGVGAMAIALSLAIVLAAAQ